MAQASFTKLLKSSEDMVKTRAACYYDVPQFNTLVTILKRKDSFRSIDR